MKHLFIDTNNFLSCALITQSSHTPGTIEKLENLLNSDKTKLFLPEIIEIEFFRLVDIELSKIQKSVNNFIETININFPNYLNKEKQEFIKSTEDIFKKRQFASKVAKAKFNNLYKSKNIVKIPLTLDIFINAYKRALAGKKPYKYERCPECNELKNPIDNDCLIFESILAKIKEIGTSELIFCSANKKDFAELDKTSNIYILNSELRAEFPAKISVKYYLSFAEAIKSEFNAKIKPIDSENIEKALEYIDTSFEFLKNQVVLQRFLAEQSKFKEILAPLAAYFGEYLKKQLDMSNALKLFSQLKPAETEDKKES
jgi:predicted nucleic-acid-binding protein